MKKPQKQLGQENQINKALFLEGLSKATKASQVEDLFGNKPGCKEVRVIPFHDRTVGFVEFENEEFACMALQALNNTQIIDSNGDPVVIQISFAKKGE
mmetsp:Transcript_23736/g.23421  ORF Transcript_23736/g.23421 Transcript_23736/m.23421 type:complete len:98 (+) Transcript_23736:656-949(+)